MRKALLLIVVMMGMATPIIAQEADCDIDLSEVETLLLQAQVSLTAGDIDGALERITQMQTALEAIEDGCITISLSESFEAPDDSFSFDYPDGWTLGEYSAENQELATVFVGTNPDVVAEGGESEPSLQSGEQLVGFLFGSLSEITGDAESDNLETVITALNEVFKTQYPNISSTEHFSHNDHRAGRFEFSGDSFAAVVLVIEYRAGERYMAVVGVSAPDELDALHPIVDAIARTIRVEGRI
jgi:hypothetical protein